MGLSAVGAPFPIFVFQTIMKIDLDWEASFRLHALANPFVFSRRVLMAHRLRHYANTSQSKCPDRPLVRRPADVPATLARPLASALSAAYRLGY